MLVHFGVAEEVAWSMRKDERFARLVVMGEYNGGTFDWDRMVWREPEK